MRVAQVGRVFADGTQEPMRGGVVADNFRGYLLQLVGNQPTGVEVAALRVRDGRGQLTVYRRRAA